jgi:hypothetical protein
VSWRSRVQAQSLTSGFTVLAQRRDLISRRPFDRKSWSNSLPQQPRRHLRSASKARNCAMGRLRSKTGIIVSPFWSLFWRYHLAGRSIRPQLARPDRTWGIVMRMIRASSPRDQLSMYCRSRRIHDSKSTLSRPLTAHRQVMPGRMRRRRRCQR